MTIQHINGFRVTGERQEQRPQAYRAPKRDAWNVLQWAPHLAAMIVPLVLAMWFA